MARPSYCNQSAIFRSAYHDRMNFDRSRRRFQSAGSAPEIQSTSGAAKGTAGRGDRSSYKRSISPRHRLLFRATRQRMVADGLYFVRRNERTRNYRCPDKRSPFRAGRFSNSAERLSHIRPRTCFQQRIRRAFGDSNPPNLTASFQTIASNEAAFVTPEGGRVEQGRDDLLESVRCRCHKRL